MISKAEQNIRYPHALLLSNEKRKTFESLARIAGISGDTMGRLSTKNILTIRDLIATAQKIFGGKKVYLLIDDTLILKTYSRVIEGTSDNYSSSDGRICRSLCSVVAMLTDGKTAIPIDQAIWTSKEFVKTLYKKKWELAQELICKIQQHIPLQMVILDGLYAIAEFMKWLCDTKIPFEMRFHSNRVIEVNGQKDQIKRIPFLKLKKGRTTKTIRALWRGMMLFFTAVKRQTKNGEMTIVFQVSNVKMLSKDHVKIYGYRWNIEKFFRTAKQKLGLNDCQSRKLDRQNGHIFNVFVAYIVAQYERKRKKLKNVETAIKSIKEQNSRHPNYAIGRFRQIFQYA